MLLILLACGDLHEEDLQEVVGAASPSACEQTTSPCIAFTKVPAKGSSQNVQGRVYHLDTTPYAVAVYIRVANGWWTKPYWDYPLTPLRPDGTWTCDITTGGEDETANAIAAFVVPATAMPPSMAGGQQLPMALFQMAVASVEVAR
jgi:hypothetical protein